MTDVEFQNKREKGLCFHCDEKYTPKHRCKKKEMRELRVLLVNDTEEIEILQATPTEEEEEDTSVTEMGDLVELHLKSVIGFSTPRTMKVKGFLKGEAIMVLIDVEPPTTSFCKNW